MSTVINKESCRSNGTRDVAACTMYGPPGPSATEATTRHSPSPGKSRESKKASPATVAAGVESAGWPSNARL